MKRAPWCFRDDFTVPENLPPLIVNVTWSAPHTNMMNELIRYISYTGPSYNSDNARVFGILSTALAGTSAMALITRYRKTRNGRDAYLSLVTHHMGKDGRIG